MRIPTAADALLASPDSGANHVANHAESNDKHRFARLLQTQPATAATAEHGDVPAQVPAVPSEGAVKSDVAAADTAATAAGDQATKAVPSATVTDAQPDTTDAASLITSTSAPLPASNDAQARLAATLLQSAKAAVTQDQKSAATPTNISASNTAVSAQSVATLATKPAQLTAAKTDSVITETVAGNNKPLPELAGKPAARSKAAAHSHMAAPTTPDSATANTEPADANTAPLLVTAAAEPDHSITAAEQVAPAASLDSTKHCASLDVATNTAAVNPSQPNMNAAAELQQNLQSPLIDTQPLTSSFEAGSARGVRLPPGGKSLPLTLDDTATDTKRNAAPDLFKQLTDAALQLPAQTPDLTAQTASQLLANATVPHAQSTDSPAPLLTNAASATLSGLPTATVVGTGDNGQSSTAPLLMSSSLAMHASGWSEETAHHIRWLKDRDLQSAEIQLHPAELGRLSISIDIKDGQASVQLLAGNAAARDLLEQSLPDLRNLLAQNGMSLADSSVTQHSGGNQTWPNRFNPLWFAGDELQPVELNTGRPAMFRSSGGSNRIDQYV